MKNKMFLLLFPLYMVVLGFILYINGVFTGNVTSLSNLLINVGFLIVIGILFIISAICFVRLNLCSEALLTAADQVWEEHKKQDGNLWEIYWNKKDVFHNEALDDAFFRYQKRMAGYRTKKGLSNTCDLEEYINEDLLDRVAATHYNSAVSGTLTGLGILGTFLGLSMGLGSFQGNDIYTISDNVGPLLEGMKVAFHTSVYGIFFSLVFNFIYRSIMADAYEKLAEFMAVYKEYVAPSPMENADENSRAMLIYQANMANSMKAIQDLLKGGAAEQTKGVERIVNQFVSQMEQTMGADFEKLGRVLNYTCKTQEQSARNYQSMESAARQLQEANQNLLKNMEQFLDRQMELAKKLEEQEKMLEATSDFLNEEVSNQLYTFNQMREAYEK